MNTLRSWLVRSLLAGVVAIAMAPRHRVDASSTLYIDSFDDTNIEALFRNTLIPDFTAAFPQYHVSYVNVLHGINGQGLVIDKMTATQAAGKSSYNLDVVSASPEIFTYPTGKTYADYFYRLTPRELPNSKRVPEAVAKIVSPYEVPYRASAVVLAYNSLEVASPPKTFAALVTWIREHPGRFTYCPPSLGGSGGAFVQAALRSVMDPVALRGPYARANEKNWPRAWSMLKALEPDLFQGGYHPNGNLAVQNLLAKGAIWMATQWSDESLDALNKHILPSYIKLTQITPALDGGPSTIAIPRLAQNPAGARAFVNFILSPSEQNRIITQIGGFPGIDFKYIDPAIVRRLGSLATGYSLFPLGYGFDMLQGWQEYVPNV